MLDAVEAAVSAATANSCRRHARSAIAQGRLCRYRTFQRVNCLLVASCTG